MARPIWIIETNGGLSAEPGKPGYDIKLREGQSIRYRRGILSERDLGMGVREKDGRFIVKDSSRTRLLQKP